VLPTDRVVGELRARIEAGEWARDERLPSVPRLADQHKTSRATMTKALHVLEGEGLLRIVPNWGTFKA
jgi:DNA-binding GntR family transcriptional regulator